jgi:hypothetical protein
MLLLALCVHVSAQDEEPVKFIQLLSWFPDEFAFRYEVTVEKQNTTGNFHMVFNGFTENDHIEISLPSGPYRYRVRAYDFMDTPSENPDWLYFDIITALNPEITGFSPDVLYLTKRSNLTLKITGKNIQVGADVRLRPLKDENSENESIGKDLIPLTFRPVSSGEQGELYFEAPQLRPGNYEIYIQNPGGLFAAKETFKIIPAKIDKDLSVGYAPIISAYGDTRKLSDIPFFPAGITGHFSIFPFQGQFDFIGISAVPAWNYASSNHIISVNVYAVFQKTFMEQTMAVNVKLGGGIFAMVPQKAKSNASAISAGLLVPDLSVGTSFLWFFHKPFFAEAAFEYTHSFYLYGTSPGHLMPSLGIGLKL